jgi:hypothetical protein
MTYQEWIDKHFPTPESQHGKCSFATKIMVKAFPELKRVRGHFVCHLGERPHWWCIDLDGKIVDPTSKQFQFPGFYLPWDETRKEPTGKCPNCGGECYDGNYLCSKNCEIAYVAYCNGAF